MCIYIYIYIYISIYMPLSGADDRTLQDLHSVAAAQLMALRQRQRRTSSTLETLPGQAPAESFFPKVR